MSVHIIKAGIPMDIEAGFSPMFSPCVDVRSEIFKLPQKPANKITVGQQSMESAMLGI